MCNAKVPPYGNILSAMYRAGNPPKLIIICFGKDSFKKAKDWQQNNQVWALVMKYGENSADYLWQVEDIPIIIDWSLGPSNEQVIALVQTLLCSGANCVTVRPNWVDVKNPAFVGEVNQPISEWRQVREMIVTYPGIRRH